MESPTYRLSANPGDVLFREHDFGSCAFVIESGRVEISIHRCDQKIILGTRGRGEVVGEMAILDCKPRSATAIALESCSLVIVTREQLQNRIDRTDPVLRMCLNVILDRFRTTLRDLNKLDRQLAPTEHAADSGLDPNPDILRAISEIRMEEQIRRGLHLNEFELHFQPIVSLFDERIRGFEALARWRHPVHGLIPPNSFIPTAEASGLILPLTRWAFTEACRAAVNLNACQAELAPSQIPVFVSVNISGRDLVDSTFVPSVRAILHDTLVSPELLRLEITETVLMCEPETALKVVEELRALGLLIVMDDFGTGYSSLSYLHSFPIDMLKIDKSFVQSTGINEKSKDIVRSIIMLASQLGLPVVAEGIETADQKAIFQELNCEYGQGFYYAKPMPEIQTQAFLNRGSPMPQNDSSMQA